MTPHFKETVNSIFIQLKKIRSNISKCNDEIIPYYNLYYSMVLVAIGDSFTWPTGMKARFLRDNSRTKSDEKYRRREMTRRRYEARDWLRDAGCDVFDALCPDSWGDLHSSIQEADRCIMSACNEARKKGGAGSYFDTRKKMSMYLRRKIMRVYP